MLTEKTRSIEVTAEAVVGDSTYNVTHKSDNGVLSEVNCNVFKEGTHVGFIRFKDGGVNTQFRDGVDAIQHLTVFNDILAEIKAAVAE